MRIRKRDFKEQLEKSLQEQKLLNLPEVNWDAHKGIMKKHMQEREAMTGGNIAPVKFFKPDKSLCLENCDFCCRRYPWHAIACRKFGVYLSNNIEWQKIIGNGPFYERDYGFEPSTMQRWKRGV